MSERERTFGPGPQAAGGAAVLDATPVAPSKTAAPPRVPPSVERPAAALASFRWLWLSTFTVLALINLVGFGYYTSSVPERLRSPFHAWLKPTGWIGQSAGVIATLLLIYLWLYPVRKHFKGLAFTGGMKTWLDLHVIAGLAIPFVAAIHASWRFNGMIGLGYGALLVVCLSGVVGRYIYVRIPRSKSGLELSYEQIAAERSALLERVGQRARLDRKAVEQLVAAEPAPYAGLGLLSTIGRLLLDDFHRLHAARLVRQRCRKLQRGGHRLDQADVDAIVKLARRQTALVQQVQVLDATHRVFRFWHVAHRPFAVTALIAVLIHVAVAVSLGVTWFW